ncbi:hypothetical protein P280DRAFT_515502 [Massarina eburnea CBS 473.64]|uniref:Piwi domain-containing protein n=1 Tax=Massarina eburnea CBS 473.64 TaxID=1395130 RepID=A0A6A6S614_9PLEO|nr:hypothetical protein P280DRAFT_515502 [Massarina eburnea CBS 473.64]
MSSMEHESKPLLTFERIIPPSSLPEPETSSNAANNSAEKQRNEQIECSNSKGNVKVGLMYLLSPKAKVKNDEIFMKDVKNRLETNKEVFDFSQIEAGLLLKDHCKEKPSKDWTTTEAPVILIAIVDESNRANGEVADLYSEIHKFGDRKLGSVTACFSKASLVRSIRANDSTYNPDNLESPLGEKHDYFPKGFLSKINYMYGGTNFEDRRVSASLSSGGPVIIIGAHIAHPGPNAGLDYPSIASVVANSQKYPRHFFGSTRVQSTLGPYVAPIGTKTKKTMPETMTRSKIIGLEDMVRERLEENWEGIDNPSMIFFRDSVVPNNRAAYQDDIKDIRAAFNRNKTVQLTYILVHRNSGTALIANEVKQKVHRLNNGNKISNSPTTTDIPLHYPNKLSRRMFNYFRYYLTNKFDGRIPRDPYTLDMGKSVRNGELVRESVVSAVFGRGHPSDKVMDHGNRNDRNMNGKSLYGKDRNDIRIKMESFRGIRI